MQGNEIEKDIFSSCHESGTKKQSQTLTGLEPSWIRPLLRIFFPCPRSSQDEKMSFSDYFFGVVVFALFVCLFLFMQRGIETAHMQVSRL